MNLTEQRRKIIKWIGQELQSDSHNLPEWSYTREMWYVKRRDSFHADFEQAVTAAMGQAVKFYPIKPSR